MILKNYNANFETIQYEMLRDMGNDKYLTNIILALSFIHGYSLVKNIPEVLR